MGGQRPDVSDEEIGIRTFQIRKARAVERAIERLRHGLGPEWASYTEREIEELEWLIGELWAFMPRNDWEDLHFGNCTTSDVVKLLGYGTELRRRSRGAVEIMNDAAEVVRARG
jgi:hypothetical protein